MGKLEQLISDTFAIMIPQQVEPAADNNICTLKKCAIRYLVNQKKLTDKIELIRFKQIQTAEQLEMFLQQYALTDSDLLSIYRDCFYNNG